MCKKCLKMRILFATGGFLIGAAVGAGATALVCRKKMKEQDKQMDLLLEEYNTLLNLERSGVTELEEMPAVKELDISDFRTGIRPAYEVREEYMAEMEEVIRREGYGRKVISEKPTLAELAQMAEDEEDVSPEDLENGIDEENDDQITIDELENPEEGEEPHEITAEDFLEDQSFDKDQLTFYIDDEILCDSDDDPLEIDSYLGYNYFMEAVTKVTRGRNSTCILYWRNPDISCDFEIELRGGSYTNAVLGVDDSERGGYKRTSKRKVKDEDDD